ncbi:hypothetical protein O4328_39200 [Rhodococcus opacus]|uniref:Uncharacterized protein n=1 Tax=Rhodococcus opacus TaxID=37919 RepID=A0AAX3YQB6_RHOOP|nr:hypothetical protein [Rhodococcus opacus]MCZ4589598.1 hypothetical protein [Rhodococcus opacus]WLF51243.1 hypothetical protein Q5707_38420 [Rhodococcus opacus]
MSRKSKRNGREQKAPTKTDVHMSVATAPSVALAHLGDEIRQSQAALLYADSVTLISPRATLIHSIAELEGAPDLKMLELMVDVAPDYAPKYASDFEELLRAVRSVPAGNQLSSPQRKQRRAALERLFDGMRPAITDLQDRVRENLSETGYRDLALAMKAGLLSIDPLPDIDVRMTGDRPGDADIAIRYFTRVQHTLTTGNTYPLFDHATSNLVSLGVEAGIFSPVPAARRRGRDAALANGLFDRLPNFEHANMSEILDIRQELRDPLQRFRQGVRQITKDIDTAPEDPQFAHDIEEAWTYTVSPALVEIENAIEENTSLRDLVRRTVADPAALTGLVGAAGLMVAAGPAFGLPAAVTLMLSSAPAALGTGLAAIRTGLAERAALEKVTETQFYFLYGTNAALA